MEKKRHEVSADDLDCYFETVGVSLKDVPSFFLWNADETRIGSPKKQCPPNVIVARDTSPETTTLAALRDDAQLTTFMAISAIGDSIPPLIITKTKHMKTSLGRTPTVGRA
jgi:hypothetical protein